jgi:biopolymer transport protein ExbD
MHFYVRKRRSTPAVIIVALIDVLIVLVIFLLVTTTFKQQNALKLQLPESSQGKQSGVTENPPLILSIDTNGVYYVDRMAITFDQLEDRLKSAVAKNPNLILEINGDDKSPLGRTVRVRDAAAAAHIKTLILLTRQPPKQ